MLNAKITKNLRIMKLSEKKLPKATVASIKM